MLALIFGAIILVVVLFVSAIVISMSGKIRDNRMEVRRLDAKLDRVIEANLSPEERKQLYRRRRENSERKRSEFEHGI